MQTVTVEVQDEGIGAFDASTLNFTGTGVAATDAGGGQAGKREFPRLGYCRQESGLRQGGEPCDDSAQQPSADRDQQDILDQRR